MTTKVSLRRRLIRWLGWTIAAFASLVAIGLLVFAAYLLSTDYEERLRQGLEDELTRVAGAPATVESFEVDWPAFAFELSGVTVEGDEQGPLLSLDRLRGALRVSEIARLQLHWSELSLNGLSLRLVEDASGGWRLPRSAGETPLLGSAGLAISADSVSLEDAVLLIENEVVPWQLDASNIDLELEHAAGSGYEGTLRYEDGTLRIKDHPEIQGTVEAAFAIDNYDLFLESLSARSAFGELDAKGKLSFAGGGSGRFEVTATGEAQPAAASIFGISSRSNAFAGTLEFRGTLSISPENKLLEGAVIWPRGRVLGVPLSGWQSDVLWDSQLLQVSFAQGRIAGGQARLQLHQPLPVQEHPAALDIDVEGASLSQLAEGYFDRDSPVESLVSGRLSLVFPADDPSQADGTFELSGAHTSSDDTPGRTPLDFEAAGRLTDRVLELESLTFQTGTVSGIITGSYPVEGPAELDVDVLAVDLAQMDTLQRDVRRFLRGEEESVPETWGISGRGRAIGKLTERLPHPTFSGTLTAAPLQWEGLTLETVEARGVLSRSQLSLDELLLHNGDGRISGRGVLALTGELGLRDFDTRLSLTTWPVSDLAELLDAQAELDGALTGELAVVRRAGQLGGTGRLTWLDPSYGGERFDEARTDLHFLGTSVRLDTLTLSRGDASIRGELELDTAEGTVRGLLAAEAFPLADGAVTGLPFDGTVDAELELSGRLDALNAEMHGVVSALQWDRVPLGDARFEGRLRHPRLELDIEAGTDADPLTLALAGELRTGLPLEGRVRFSKLYVNPWLAYISPDLAETVDVHASGEASFRGELERAESLLADLSLSTVEVVSDPLRFESLAPIAARLEAGVLRFPTLVLAQDTNQLRLGGEVDIQNRDVDIRVEGAAGAGLVQTFFPGIAATGELDLSGRVSGVWEQPSMTGHADLKNVTARLDRFPQAIGGLAGRVVFDNRTVRIPELTGVFGSGPVVLSGLISMQGLAPVSLDLELAGTGMRLRYPEGLAATVDADLALLGDLDEQVLSGRITLTDAVWTREYDLVAGILTDRDSFGLFEEFEGEELIDSLRFDVTIVAPETLRLRNTLAEIDASAELELRGSLDEPILLGRSEAQRGDVYFLGQRYDITDGKVEFVDPTKVEPFIDLTAEARVRSYRVELRLTGTPDRFYPELSSDPPLRIIDILRLLAGANENDLNLIGTEEEELAGVGVASLLTERLSQEVGRRAERLFGLDRFSINPFLVGQFANPTARVSLGKRITRDLSVNYSTNLNRTTEAIILIEYTPEGNVSWILSRDEEGAVGLDVKFRKSF